ncbi:MAG: SufE family protein [Alphaproteobacteria bacterium]
MEKLTGDALVENFQLFDDWEDRYAYIIDLSKQLAPMDAALKNDQTKLDGCISQVWITHDLFNDAQGIKRIHFNADSDAVLVKGLISLLLTLYQDSTPTEILELPIEQIMTQIGLSSHLSVNRRNGFQSMLSYINNTARNAS